MAGVLAASNPSAAVQEPELYTLYLVDSEEQAAAVQEWLLYGETLVVADDTLTRLGGFRSWYGDKKIQITDLRER